MSVLNFKPFFVHRCRNRTRTDKKRLQHAPRGFTVFVQPSGKERTVNVQVALCAYQDDFSKKNGRETSTQQKVVEINARDLPHVLSKLSAKMWDCGQNNFRGEFDYVMRYLV